VSQLAGTEYTVGNYLADRLVDAGVDRVFGVPGDYTLALLDYLVSRPGLAWTGCANELNAGYAADGYARMRGIGALCTTFGVGELSAINAVAGSFAEHVPVVHIVGSPASGTQAAHRIVHHSLGDGIFGQFADMSQGITCAKAALTAGNAAAEIDRVLAAVKSHRLPGYLLIPADVASAPATPPSAPLPSLDEPADPDAVEGFTVAARQLLATAPSLADVVVLSGLLAHRFGAASDLARLLAAGPLTHATTLWGKSLVDESDPYFTGVYAGAASAQVTREAVEDAAVLITAGVQFTDLNSGFFTQKIDRRRTIEIGAGAASVGAAMFSPVPLRVAVQALTPLIAEMVTRQPRPAARPAPAAGPLDPLPAGTPLSQETLWDSVARSLRPDDVILADQGTSFYGAATHRLPHGATFIGQPLWASIGYTLPALLGACLASPQRRGILLIGDGAAQMTVQELSTIVHSGISATVIVVDNDGYTVERAIHGPEQPYNDIARWDWTNAPAFFGAGRDCAAVRVTTVGELDQTLAAASASKLTLIQAVVPRMDVPELLEMIARAASKANAQAES
jgi:TPP-dependent 2-oxoacid decarboxylase